VGTATHRFIMNRAIDLLPPEVKPFFEHYRTDLVVRVIDSNLRRAFEGFARNNPFAPTDVV
jgi:hypothetical protein